MAGDADFCWGSLAARKLRRRRNQLLTERRLASPNTPRGRESLETESEKRSLEFARDE